MCILGSHWQYVIIGLGNGFKLGTSLIWTSDGQVLWSATRPQWVKLRWVLSDVSIGICYLSQCHGFYQNPVAQVIIKMPLYHSYCGFKTILRSQYMYLFHNSPHLNLTGSWNPSRWKAETHTSFIISNNIAAAAGPGNTRSQGISSNYIDQVCLI